MVIRLLPSQIAQVWNAIKFASSSVSGTNEHDLPLYLNKLLASLLNNKAQCFVRLNEAKQLMAIAITRFVQDEITGEKSLFWESLYSFKIVPLEQWNADFPLITEFARNNSCKKIIFNSSNERVFELAIAHGFRERYRSFVLDL